MLPLWSAHLSGYSPTTNELVVRRDAILETKPAACFAHIVNPRAAPHASPDTVGDHGSFRAHFLLFVGSILSHESQDRYGTVYIHE